MKIGALYRSDTKLFWQVLARVESAESSRRIIHYALVGTRHLARLHRKEMLRIAQTVFQRFRNDPNGSSIRCECLSIVLTANVAGENPYGDELIGTVISNMATFTAEAVHLVQQAAEALTLGPVDQPDPHADRLRGASFAFLVGITNAVREWARTLEPQVQGRSREELTQEVIGQAEAARRVGHELGIRLYFASGAFDEKMGRTHPHRGKLTLAMKARFLREAAPLLKLLTELGYPDAVHNALETLVAYVAIDPQVAFLAAAQAVRNGQAGGYQFEDLAVNLVVGLVRRYIADYASLFREDPQCRDALMDILNIFVKAGWAEAIELTGRLDQIFR
jgi:hypothetical protein